MRILAIIVSMLTAAPGMSQSRVFLHLADSLLSVKDTSLTIEESSPGADEYDVLNDDGCQLESIFQYALHDLTRERKEPIQKSTVLSQLAAAATKSWRGSQYADKKKWSKLNKYFKRALRKSTAGFGVTRQISFRMELVDNPRKDFYHDRSGPEGQLNLYEGSIPRTEEEQDREQVPLAAFTQSDLMDEFVRELKKKGLYREVIRGVYSFTGVSAQIDERTLFRKKIPTARVVVILGARRLRMVKVRAK